MNKGKVSIGLSNPKSPSNVGAVMRAAGCFEATEVFYTGERFDRANKFATDTQNCSDSIGLNKVTELLHSIPAGATVVCVELALGASSLLDFKHPQQAYYLFGPEDDTLSQSILNQAAEVIYIPTQGCLNLAATVNVVLYDRLAKSKPEHNSDDLIKSSRDTNNRVLAKKVMPQEKGH